MTNFDPNSAEYVELYPEEKEAVPAKIILNEIDISEGQLSTGYSQIIDSGTPSSEDKALQVPLWMSSTPEQTPAASVSDLDDQEESLLGTSYGKKARRPRRTLNSKYEELADEEKQSFIYSRVYSVLDKINLDKTQMTALLYSLGDAIAASEYPIPKQRQSRRPTKVDPQTIVQYIEQLSEEDKAELLAHIKIAI